MLGEDEGPVVQAAHEALVAEGLLEPLAKDPTETRRWLDCEVASLVENRFFAPIDPLALTPGERARWEPRATSDEPLSSPHDHAWYRIAYWFKEGGERAGTVALATSFMGPQLVTVSSLYTFPAFRRRGLAGKLLRRAHEVAVTHGAGGLRVPTHWTWQPAVRFYLGLGMWLHDWKHALVFGWRHDGATPQIEIGDREARLSALVDGVATPLIEAARAGDRLIWNELPALRKARRSGAFDHAPETFAIALATRGYPLIRSAAAWEDRHRWADGGQPEGLAYKIESWEAWERRQGHAIRTPRIPALAYRAWDEID